MGWAESDGKKMDRSGRFTLERWLQGVALHDTRWLMRRHWRLLLCFTALGAGLGVGYFKLNPDTYVSRAQVRFIPPQVNERYVMPNVAMQAEQRIFALTQILNSRLTATRMIETFALYPERRMFYPVADLVDRFQADLELRQSVSGSTDPNLRTVPSLAIAFRYSNAELSRKVVRRIMELVYEENRRYRGDQSIGTTEFLQQQVKIVVDQMGELETKLSLLPAGTGQFSNLVEVEELHDTERRLTDAKHQQRTVHTERELRAGSVAAIEGQLRAFDKEPPQRPPSQNWELNQMRARAAEARQRYGTGHPDREAAESALQRLEQEFARVDGGEQGFNQRMSRDVIAAQLGRSRAELDGFQKAYDHLEREINTLGAKVVELRARFQPAEVKDLDRMILTREYNGLQDYYKDLLKKHRESQVASEMERRGQGESVELIEPPTLPGSPEQPNWVMKIGLGLLFGLCSGMSLVMLRFLRRPRLLCADHLPLILDVAVIAELPAGPVLALPAAQRAGFGRNGRSRKLREALQTSSVLALTVAVAFLAASCARESAGDLMARANKLAQAHDEKGAILLYRKVLQLDARHAEANLQLADVYTRTGQILPARERLIRAVELLPDRTGIAVRLAELSYQIYFADPGRPAPLLREIEEMAERMLERAPDQPDGYRLKAQALSERRRASEAIALLEPAVKRLALNAPLVAQLATSYYQNQETAKAETTLRELLTKQPTYVQGYDLLYLLQMETRRGAEARLTLEQKVQHNRVLANVLQLAAHDDALGARAQVKKWLPLVSGEFSTDAQAFVQIGDFWLHRGEFALARSVFQAGQLAHAKSRSLYAGRLVETHVAEKNPQEARRLVELELRNQPADPLLKAYQSALDLEMPGAGERARARAQLETILNSLPNSPFVRFHLGRAYLRDGDFPRAGEQLERCVSLDPNYAPGWVALAEANFAAGHHAQADHLVRSALKRAPSYVPALLLQAQMSLAARKPDEAEAALHQLLNADANNQQALASLAQVRLANGKPVEAEALLARLDAQDAGVTMLRAQAKAASGKVPEALALLEDASRREPGNIAVRHTLARLALRAGKTAMALAHYQKLVAEKPNDLELRLGFANALGLSGEKQKAAAEYRQVQAKSGQDARPWLHYAALMSQEGNANEARDGYREALNRDKNNPYALNNLAFLMAKKREDLQTALSYAQQAKRTMPESAAINDTLAYIYLLLGMSRNAAAAIEETLPGLGAEQRKQAQGFLARLQRGETAPVLAEVERGALRFGKL